jgi:hypothetical protein
LPGNSPTFFRAEDLANSIVYILTFHPITYLDVSLAPPSHHLPC